MDYEKYEKTVMNLIELIKRPRLTQEQHTVLSQIFKEDPTLIPKPASDNELAAVINYMNNVPDTNELSLGVKRYKDAFICPLFADRSKHYVICRDSEEQMIDFVEYLQQTSDTGVFNFNPNNIFTIKSY